MVREIQNGLQEETNELGKPNRGKGWYYFILVYFDFTFDLIWIIGTINEFFDKIIKNWNPKKFYNDKIKENKLFKIIFSWKSSVRFFEL